MKKMWLWLILSTTTLFASTSTVQAATLDLEAQAFKVIAVAPDFVPDGGVENAGLRTPTADDLAEVQAALGTPVLMQGQAVRRYVSAEDAGVAVYDVFSVAGNLTAATLTVIPSHGEVADVAKVEVLSAEGDQGWLRLSSDQGVSTSAFALDAGCSSDCNAASTIGGLAVGIACEVVTKVLGACSAAGAAAGWAINDNCKQSTLCVPRVTTERQFCYTSNNGCRALGSVVSSPKLANVGTYQHATYRYENNAFYRYYAPAQFYYREGTATQTGNSTYVTYVTNGSGVYFYGFQHDTPTHLFACPNPSTVAITVNVEGGNSAPTLTPVAGCN